MARIRTQPTQIYFGPDGGPPRGDTIHSNVTLRTLLYSTAKRGQLIESMYVRLRRGETAQNFNVCVYDEKRPLSRGSGLFVGKTGVTENHHFLSPLDGTPFEFTARYIPSAQI